MIFANPYCEVLYGSPPDELVGQDALRLALRAGDARADLRDRGRGPQRRELGGRVPRRARRRQRRRRARDRLAGLRRRRQGRRASSASRSTSPRSGSRRTSCGACSPSRRSCATSARRSSPELDAERVMQTITGAARKLTGASMAAFLRGRTASRRRRPSSCAASSGTAREQSLGVALAARRAAARGRARERRARSASTTLTREPGYAETLDGHAALAHSAVAQLHRDAGALARRRGRGRDGRRASPRPTASRRPKRSCSPTSRRRPASCSTSRACSAPPRTRSSPGAVPRRCSGSSPRRARCSRRRSTIPRASSGSGGSACRSSPTCASSTSPRSAASGGSRPCTPIPTKEAARRRAREALPARSVSARIRRRSVVRGGELGRRRARCPTSSSARPRATSATSTIVKELEFTSYMCVPLEARGRVLGALTLVSSGSGRSLRAARPRARRGVRPARRARARQRAPLLRARPRRARAAVEPAAAVAARDPRRRASPRATAPRARATRSAATSTTCSRSTSTRGGS